MHGWLMCSTLNGTELAELAVVDSTVKKRGSAKDLHASPSGCTALEKGAYHSTDVPKCSDIGKRSATVGGVLDLVEHHELARKVVGLDLCTASVGPM